MTKWVLDHDALFYAARRAGYTHVRGGQEMVEYTRLAFYSNLSQATIYSVFDRVGLPTARTLITLADTLGVDVMDLVKQVGE